MKSHKKEENTMQLPKEKKLPTCTHEPTEWAECARCIENYYLARLTDVEQRCAQVRRQLTVAAGALRTADVLIHEPAGPEITRRRTLKDYNAEDCTSVVFASLKLGRERSSGAPLARLRELVEAEESSATPGVWFGRGKVFSVLKNAPPVAGGSQDEVLEGVLLAVLGELEAQKAALEIRAALAESERDAQKARAVLAETSQRGAEEAHRAELRGAIADLRAQKDGVYAERNELAALIVQMARALGLPAGWRADADAEEGWQTLLVVQLPAGQVSWHLPNREREITEYLSRAEIPWDGHDKATARKRIREAIRKGFRTVWSLAEKIPAAAADEPPHLGAGALAATAPRCPGGEPCWCQVDWRGMRPSNHGDICERLTALLQELKKEEEKRP